MPYRNRYNPSPEKALCVVLSRLAWPHRLCDQVEWFGCSPAQLSSVYNDVTTFLALEYEEKLLWDTNLLTIDALRAFSQVINASGGGDRVWGWVDGTIIRIARPQEDQNLVYTAYKKCHGVKFQGVVTPNGLIASLAGPVVAGKSDFALLGISGLEEKVTNLWTTHGVVQQEELFLYGDPAYCSSRICLGAYKSPPGGRMTESQRRFNRQMAKTRIEVEHGFGLWKNLWTSLEMSRNLRSGLSPIGSWMRTAVLFTNIFTCMKGNQTSQRFGLAPPTLEEYLRPLVGDSEVDLVL